MPKTDTQQKKLIEVKGTADRIWLGLDDKQEESTFTWADGDTLAAGEWNSWNDGEPNNWGPGEDCVELRGSAGKAGWNDIGCAESFTFVCQKSSSTDPVKPTVTCPQGWQAGTPGICYKVDSQVKSHKEATEVRSYPILPLYVITYQVASVCKFLYFIRNGVDLLSF